MSRRDQIVEVLIGQPVISGNHTVPVTPRDAHLLAAVLLPLVDRLRAEAAAEALEQAADWLVAGPDQGGAPFITSNNTVHFPDWIDLALVTVWAAESLRDRAAAVNPSKEQQP